MEIIIHKAVDDWGVAYQMMEKNGKGFGRTYLFNGQFKNIYLDMLTVSKDSRNQGIATELLRQHEKIGSELGCKNSLLWVKKRTWIRDWYKRKGYSYYGKKGSDKTSVWLSKRIL